MFTGGYGLLTHGHMVSKKELKEQTHTQHNSRLARRKQLYWLPRRRRLEKPPVFQQPVASKAQLASCSPCGYGAPPKKVVSLSQGLCAGFKTPKVLAH